MKFLKYDVAGAWVIDPTPHPDERGLPNPDMQLSLALQHDQTSKVIVCRRERWIYCPSAKGHSPRRAINLFMNPSMRAMLSPIGFSQAMITAGSVQLRFELGRDVRSEPKTALEGREIAA